MVHYFQHSFFSFCLDTKRNKNPDRNRDQAYTRKLENYTFLITKEGIELTSNPAHNLIRCNGKYKVMEGSSTLDFYFTGNIDSCHTQNALFYLKEENGDLFAQGLGGKGTYDKWIKLRRK